MKANKSLKNLCFLGGLIYKGNPGFIVRQGIAILFNVCMTVYNILIIKLLINAMTDRAFLGWGIALVVLTSVMFFIIDSYRTAYQHYFLERDIVRIKEKINLELMERARKLDYALYDNDEHYNKMNKTILSADNSVDQLIQSLTDFIETFVNVFTILTLAAVFDPIVMLCGLITSIVTYFRSIQTIRLNREKYEEKIAPTRWQTFTRNVFFNRDSVKELKAYPSLRNIFINEYQRCSDQLADVISKKGKQIFKVNLCFIFLRFIFENIVPWSVIMWKACMGSITIGTAVVLMNVTEQLPWQLSAFLKSFGQFRMQSIYIEDLRYIWEYNAQIEKKGGKVLLSEIEKVTFHEVYFEYYEDKPVLQNLTFFLQKGRRYAFVGENGTGKTTMIKLLARLYDVNKGSIYINEEDIRQYDVTSLRGQMALLYQDFIVYPFTIAQNVSLETPDHNGKYSHQTEVKIYDALSKVDIKDFIEQLPLGIYTNASPEFNPQGQFLSGGQKQKIALARAIYNKQSLLVFDEPSSALDPISERIMMQNLTAISQNKILLLVTHRMKLAKASYYEFYMAQEEDY